MPLDPKVYGAGAKDCKIKVAGGTIYDVGAIVEVSGDPQQDTVDIKGDDELKTKFVFAQTENVTIKANAISFDALQAITGNSISSSAVGEEIPLGTDSEQNSPFIEVRSYIRARRDDGTATTVLKTFHKVQVQSIKVISSNGNELNVEITATAYKTSKDITGASLSPARVATLKEATNL